MERIPPSSAREQSPGVTPVCPKCGTVLDGESLDGLCRKCLSTIAFAFGPIAGDESGVAKASDLRQLGDYELLEEIARGGMGVVYKARQLRLHRIVAVKVVMNGPFSSPQFVQRFKTEAEAAARLHHPNIVSIYEVGEQEGQHYFSMEYIEGQNLAALTREKALPAKLAARYLKAIAEAVHYAHQHGVLHRDLKPSNLLLDIFDQPRVTDFGLARQLDADSHLTLSGEALGSPSYMAPEQALGRHGLVGPASDIYSLGAVLYHLLATRPPFQGDTVHAVLLQVQTADPVALRRLNPGVPRDLETICHKCLEKDPAKRYASAQALAEDLDRFLRDEPIRARPILPIAAAWRSCRRRPAVATLAAAFALALIVGLWQARRAEIAHAVAATTQAQSRMHEYTTDVRAAGEAAERGLVADARRLLLRHVPAVGEPDERGFEWRLIWNQSQGRQIATFTNHTTTVCSVAVSPDGRWAASSGMDSRLCLWNLETHQLHRSWSIDGVGWFLEFSPDGALLLSSKDTDKTAVWRVADGTLVRELPGARASVARDVPLIAGFSVNPFLDDRPSPLRIFNYANGEVVRDVPDLARAVALSPNGRIVAVGLLNSNLVLRAVDTGQELATLSTASEIFSLRFSANGRHLVATGAKSVGLWDLDQLFKESSEAQGAQWFEPPVAGQNPLQPETLFRATSPRQTPTRMASGLEEGHWLRTWAAAFSPDNRIVASTSSDRTVRLWDAATLKPLDMLTGHADEVWCVAWTPDGKYLLTGGKDSKVMLWEVGRERAEIALSNVRFYAPAISADGARVLTHPDHNGRPGSALWNPQGQQLDQWPRGRWFVGLAPDGSALETDAAQGTLNFWSPTDQKPRRSITLESFAGSGELPLRGTGVSEGGRFLFVIRPDGQARIWDVTTGRLRRQFQTRKLNLISARLSRDGQWLAFSADFPYEAYLYHTGTGQERVLRGHTEYVKSIAFSPDDELLATAGIDGRVKLWKTVTGAEVHTFTGHSQNVDDVAFAPDGHTLASIETGHCIKLWRLDTFREVASLPLPDAGQYLVFAPTGERLWFVKNDGAVNCFNAPPPDDGVATSVKLR